MNRQRVVLIALALLLLVWMALWRMTRPRGGSASFAPAPIIQKTQGNEKMAAGGGPRSSDTPAPQAASTRDPFRISDRAKEILRQQEEERLRKEREAEEAARAALEAQTAKPQEPAAPVVLPQLSLQGIILGAQPKAIINRKIVKVGDTIEGAKVTRIEKNQVTVEFEGHIFPITAATPERKSPREAPSGPGYPPSYGGSREGHGPGRWGGL